MIDEGIAKDLIAPINGVSGLDSGLILLGDWHSKGLKENWWSGAQKDVYINTTRSSDLMLENLRVFKEYSSNYTNKFSDAIDLVDEIVTDFEAVNNGTGLLTDFIHKDNGTYIPASQEIYDELHEPFPINAYSENSCRVPQRFALDYIHGHTDTSMADALENIYDFVLGLVSVNNHADWNRIIDGYMVDGNPISRTQNHGVEALQFSSCFISSTVVGMDQFVTRPMSSGYHYLYNQTAFNNVQEDAYFKDTLSLMNMLIVSDNWWNPLDEGNTTPPDYDQWVSTKVYYGGDKVSHNGANYEAQWWTKGDNPNDSAPYGPWVLIE